MARLPRLEIPGQPHLLIHRGHNRQAVFVDDDDRQAFRAALRSASAEAGVALHAYALGRGEISLLATPGSSGALGRMMQRIGRRYVLAFNRRHQRQGSLWEGRFRATVIEPERYLLTCMRLVEASPVHEQLVVHARDWIWSSAACHLGERSDPLVTDHAVFWTLGNTPFERQASYARLLEQPLDETEQTAARSAAERGWALGGEAYVASLAGSTHRRLEPRPRGRPPRSRTAPGRSDGSP